MNSSQSFRKYLDILAEQEPTAFQQGVQAVKQGYQTYKQAAAGVDSAVKTGAIPSQAATSIKGQVASSMAKAGIRAGLQGGNPSVYVGSQMGDIASAAAGISKQYADAYQKYAPGSEGFKKLTPAQQAQATQAFSTAPTPTTYDTSVTAAKQSAQQMMNPQSRTIGAATTEPQAAEYQQQVASKFDMTDTQDNPITNEVDHDLERMKKFVQKR